jgi:hypothetical protein
MKKKDNTMFTTTHDRNSSGNIQELIDAASPYVAAAALSAGVASLFTGHSENSSIIMFAASLVGVIALAVFNRR